MCIEMQSIGYMLKKRVGVYGWQNRKTVPYYRTVQCLMGVWKAGCYWFFKTFLTVILNTIITIYRAFENQIAIERHSQI